MKVNVTLDDALVERIDAHAKDFYMSRSGLVSIACAQYLNAYEGMRIMQDMALSFQKIADSGAVDDDTLAELEDLNRALKMLTVAKG